MAHEWSYTKSSIKHQLQQTKELHVLKIPDQISCPLDLQKDSASLSLTIVQFEGSLNSFHVADLIHIQFFIRIFTGI